MVADTVTHGELSTLARDTLKRLGMDAEDAAAAGLHFANAEIADRGGIHRLMALTKVIERMGLGELSPITVVHESDQSASIDGGGHIGYAVAARATDVAIAKAKANGIAVVSANNHRFSGVVGLYVD